MVHDSACMAQLQALEDELRDVRDENAARLMALQMAREEADALRDKVCLCPCASHPPPTRACSMHRHCSEHAPPLASQLEATLAHCRVLEAQAPGDASAEVWRGVAAGRCLCAIRSR
jgi:hypothetical protein